MDFYSTTESSPKFLAALTGLLGACAPGRPARDALETMLARLVETMGYNRAYLELLDVPGPGQRLSLSQGRQVLFDYLQGPGPLVTGQIIGARQPMIIENLKDHPDFFGRTVKDQEELALVCVPVFDAVSQGGAPRQALGALCADMPKAPPVFLERQREFLSVAAEVFCHAALRYREEAAKPKLRVRQEAESQSEPAPLPKAVAVSKSMRLALRQVEQAAPGDSPVLLLGEEGVGKQFLAHVLHAEGPRRKKTFLHLACAAEPQEAVDRAFFGVSKGDVSRSSHSKRGVFELAQGGTVFFEDIEALSLSAQEGLLRFLQEGLVQRLGATDPQSFDTRVVASSKANLEELMNQGAFLEDLFYALNVLAIYVPPLRDRTADILPLAESFLLEFSQTTGKPFKRISTPAIDLINQYHWPDNVIELRSCMERAFDQCEDGVIRAYHLPPTLQTAESSNTEPTLSFSEAVDQFEKELLIEALKKAKGNMFQAAQDLRDSYRIVNYKVKKHGIDPKRFTASKRR
ncbi:sigma 54-interacting transcriptional regulator [Fundidesulfovibrio butyratiphilus]